MNILDKIVAVKRNEVVRLIPSANELREAALRRKDFRDFKSAVVRKDRIRVIAEVKKASPSAGVIQPDFDPVQIAYQYQDGGANAISVLTDEKFFQGHIEYLERIRLAVNLPLLRKEFIIDPVQVYEAAARGADAILLIVAILSDSDLRALHELALQFGLAVLVEVHNEQELERAMSSGAKIIGINNRDLRDFSVNLEITERLTSIICSHPSKDFLIVAESGIQTKADVERVAQSGVDAILVGESLMRSVDIRAKIRELVGADGLIDERLNYNRETED